MSLSAERITGNKLEYTIIKRKLQLSQTDPSIDTDFQSVEESFESSLFDSVQDVTQWTEAHLQDFLNKSKSLKKDLTYW